MMGLNTSEDIKREEREFERNAVLESKLRARFEGQYSILLEEKKKEFNPATIDKNDPYYEAWEQECAEEIYWFQSAMNKEMLFKRWLDDSVFPEAERGNKIGEIYAELRKRKDDPRHAEWKEYPDFLNSYFKRNPKHLLTDGRRACAKMFTVSLRTIERRTVGYKKPPTS